MAVNVGMEDYRTPGQLIESLLLDRGWSQRTLAIVLEKGETSINKMVAGKQPVDAEMALLLEEVFGVDAERFLDLQRKYDLALARITTKPDHGRATRAALFGDLPITAMRKRGWLNFSDPHDLKSMETELAKFFGVASSSEIEILPHAARKTAVNFEPNAAQMAWLYRVKAIAEDLLVPKFSVEKLEKIIPKLRTLTIAPEEVRHVPRILADCGIRFVIVESLPASKIDGVCFWLDDVSPVVGLSVRFDRIDNFWFVLRHEIEHVRLGHGRVAIILDTDLKGENASQSEELSNEERLANKAAQEFCVPSAKMDAFIARKAPFFSERDLLGFAKLLGVHPGIVAGQLQYKTNQYDKFRPYLVPIRTHLGTGVAIDGWGEIYPFSE